MNSESSQPATSSSLDFSSLALPVSAADITNYRKQYERKGPIRAVVYVTIVVVIALCTFGTALPMFFVNGYGAVGSFVSAAVFGGVGVLMVLGVYLLTLNRYKRLIKLQRFADANGIGFKHDISNPAYSGMIFNEGHTRELSEAFSFPGLGEIGNFTYVTGSGKNRQTHTYGFVRLKLPRRLPQMVLDSRKNNFLGMSNLPAFFEKSQKLALEGDFNEHFTLYAPKQYERDAFYVFTPDVMARLVDDGGAYDMEVIDDNLFIYRGTVIDLSSRAELEKLLAIARSIGGELREQTDYYADERVGNRAINLVAPEGARLKRGFNFVIVGVVFAVIFFQFGAGPLASYSPGLAAVAGLLFGAVLWGFMIFAIIKGIRR